MNLGDGSFDDRTYQAGLGINTRLLGWGVSFIDIDNDGWLDILVANGHVYPEVDGTQVDAAYAERKYLYRNLRNGQFEDVSLIGGSGITTRCEGAWLCDRRLRQRRRYRCGGELRECGSATAALRFDAESELDQDSRGGNEDEPDRHRRAHQSSRADRIAVADCEARFPAHPDRGGALLQRILLSQRFADSFRAGRGEEGGLGGDSLALGRGRHAERPRREPALRDRGGRKKEF